MARLRDVATVMKTVGPWTFARRVGKQVNEDNLMVWAAALAYSWLFAIFPFFIFLMTLVPYLPDSQKDLVKTTISQTLRQSLPEKTGAMLQERVDSVLSSVLDQPHGAMMGVGILLTLWAASGGMAMTMAAMDRCYDVEVSRPFYRQRPVAILLTMAVAILLLAIILLLPVGTQIIRYLWGHLQDQLHLPLKLKYLLNVTRWSLAVVLMVMLLCLVYHFGTSVKQRFRVITPGAVFCIVLWIGMGMAFRYYVNRYAAGSYDRMYGAVGGVVILLLLFFIDALILLVGAEINSAIDLAVPGVANGTANLRGVVKDEH